MYYAGKFELARFKFTGIDIYWCGALLFSVE